MRIQQFFDEEFKLYSIADCVRSIPSIVDGFKPSQRKCIYGTLTRGENADELRVSQLSGLVSQCMAPETEILLANGKMIRVDALTELFDSGLTEIDVFAYNEVTKQVEVDTCTNAWVTKEVTEIIDIELEDGTIVSLTSNHIVYTARGQLRVDELVIGDAWLGTNIYRYITDIVIKQLPTPTKVYDITVKNNHNFFASKSHILLHNCAAYHHGEASLNKTIVGLAQNFTGTNNLNYLEPIGQFGNRFLEDAAAPRYIHTKISSNFRKIFKKEDDIILDHLDDDGLKIEPKYYIPILPNILINGARGIGSGYSTRILKYNPKDLRDNILDILTNKEPREIIPWYNGFTGTFTKGQGGQYLCTGNLIIESANRIRITEIPIDVNLADYEEHLQLLQEQGFIREYDNKSKNGKFEFVLNVPRATTGIEIPALMNKLKLIGKFSQVLTLWTEDGNIKVFDNIQEIIDHFVLFRLEMYEVRRQSLLKAYNDNLDWLNEKLRFIHFYIDNSQLFAQSNGKELQAMLTDNDFTNNSDLLEIRIYNLTKDDIDKLEKQIEKVKKDIAYLESTTKFKMYLKELKELEL